MTCLGDLMTPDRARTCLATFQTNLPIGALPINRHPNGFKVGENCHKYINILINTVMAYGGPLRHDLILS